VTPSFPEVRLMARSWRPYMSKLLWALQPVAHPGLGTLAVDQNLRCYYDPEILKTWKIDRCAAALLHESLHIFLCHHERAQRLRADPKVWNIAGDLEINCILRRDNLAPQPLGDDALYPEKYGFPADLTAEEYYALLQKQEEGKPQPGKPQPGDKGDKQDDGKGQPGPGEAGEKPSPGRGACGSCADGHAHDWELDADDEAAPAASKVTRDLLQQAVAQDIKQAMEAAGRGSVPGGLVSYVEALGTSKVRWQDVLGIHLRTAIEKVAGYEAQSYARPGRLTGALAGHGGAMFASWYEPKIRVGAVVDTSGSMGGGRVTQALTEVQQIAIGAGADVLFTSVDSRAAEVVEIADIQDVRLQGGGGTDMRVGIQAMLDHHSEPHLIIVLTDCDTPWPSEPTPIPLLVVGIDAYAAHTVPSWATYINVTSN
jgi:predicted metal-dependent peptidase